MVIQTFSKLNESGIPINGHTERRRVSQYLLRLLSGGEGNTFTKLNEKNGIPIAGYTHMLNV